MLLDLAREPISTDRFRARVCIIGAGIAGLTLAKRLAAASIDVLLLEAGGLKLSDISQHLFHEVTFPSHQHLGTTEGRFRTLGGTSTRWGGQLLTPPTDLPGWPITPEELAPHYRAAEELLHIDALPYDAAAFFATQHPTPPSFLAQLPELTPRLSKWAPFAYRNMATTLGRELSQHPRVSLCLNAPVHALIPSANHDRIARVLIQTPSGQHLHLTAEHIVIAAGTIETVRLLLASNIANQHDQLGRNFHDHLTLPAATLTGPARTYFAKQTAPWLAPGGTLHTLKLEASPTLCRGLDINPALAHITLDEPEGSGLSLLRELLTARQRGTFASTLTANASRLPAALLDAAKLAATARFQHRRYIAPGTQLTLRINTAQDAPSTSRITLAREPDSTGFPKAIIDWRISPRELYTFHRFAQHLQQRLSTLGLNEGIDWNTALLNVDNAAITAQLDDARHAMGGACMSTSPQQGIAQPNLTVHGLANLHLASCATFPTGSPQLPTLTLMALTLRLAIRLIADLAT